MAGATSEPLASDVPRREESLLSKTSRQAVNYATEFSAGLTVSFVAMSLGAAFGVASKRGPLQGILSAGFIAIITAILGGTKVQCSGPTAPMTAVTISLVSAVMDDGLVDADCGEDIDCKDRFINMTMVVMAVCLILCAVCRIGTLVKFVPKIVISGFMNGIAVLIWWGEANKVFGFTKDAYEGGLLLNLVIMLCTTAICLGLPILLGKTGIPVLKKLLPATLVAIVAMTAVGLAFNDIRRVDVGEPISSFADVTALFSSNFPSTWSGSWLVKAIPFALNLTMLCYLDTLLTGLVMDQKVDEKYKGSDRWPKTQQNKELVAQGIANGFVALFGGIPGAQATIRSVLILNEGARTRLAGVCVGVFAIVEMVALQSLVGMIPAAVFSGVLLKVGHDVFDYEPIFSYIKCTLMGKAHPDGSSSVVSHLDLLFILGTTAVTIAVNLNVAVFAFTLAFYSFRFAKINVPDMPTAAEVEASTGKEVTGEEVSGGTV